MQKIARRYKLILSFFLLFPVLLIRADTPLQTAEKTVIKTYPVTHNSRLSINNQYGDIAVKTWTRQSVFVKIMVFGKATKTPEAEALISLVKIETGVQTGEIKFRTVIDTAFTDLQLSSGRQCHIRYEVYLPQWLPLKLMNRFGNIEMGNYKGNLFVDEKFGDFKAGMLTGKTTLAVEQGNVSINQLSNSDITVKGFKAIVIKDLSASISAKFSYGKQVDLGLSNKLRRLTIDADNVTPLTVRNLKQANADMKIHATLSKCIYNTVIQFPPNRKQLPANDSIPSRLPSDPDSLVLLKKLKELPFMKKVNDYQFKTGNAQTAIKINISFSVLDVRD